MSRRRISPGRLAPLPGTRAKRAVVNEQKRAMKRILRALRILRGDLKNPQPVTSTVRVTRFPEGARRDRSGRWVDSNGVPVVQIR